MIARPGSILGPGFWTDAFFEGKMECIRLRIGLSAVVIEARAQSYNLGESQLSIAAPVRLLAESGHPVPARVMLGQSRCDLAR